LERDLLEYISVAVMILAYFLAKVGERRIGMREENGEIEREEIE